MDLDIYSTRKSHKYVNKMELKHEIVEFKVVSISKRFEYCRRARIKRGGADLFTEYEARAGRLICRFNVYKATIVR